MTVLLDICLVFAIQASHAHDMRKSAIPVPNAWIMELYTDTPDPLDQYNAAEYALALPRLWNRAKVEIWAEDYCNEIRQKHGD